MSLHSYGTNDRVEVTIRRYPDRPEARWVRRGVVVRRYPNQIDVRFDDSGLENSYILPIQKDWVRKLSILELIAEAAL